MTEVDTEIVERARYWATAPIFDLETRNEISNLLEANNYKEITDRFYRDLEFGTGGLRGIMGAGSSRMNKYNIRRATAALALQLIEEFGTSDLKVGIAYDSRRGSREFARFAVEVMAGYGIKSLITDKLKPVPLLSFLIRDYGCVGGICITASHNPPDYNGYKVYWQTGGQITPPYDDRVIERYKNIDRFEDILHLDYEAARSQSLVEEIGDELDDRYFEVMKTLSMHKEGREGFKIVFTPLHGTAGEIVPRGLALFGFNQVTTVPEQRQPDGNFPTVKFPNPEDPDALKMAVQLATKEKADLVLGTDPDCDRIGIVVREGESYKFLNGNQIGSLLIEYVLSSLRELGRMPENPLVVKTVVTTDLQNHIGEYYGVHVDETLTGFKWICQLIEEYESGRKKPYRKYVCGGEESYGFLAGSFVRDKDGVSACCLAAEMVAYYKSKGLSVFDVLDDVFRRHGVFQEELSTITLPGRDGALKIARMMSHLRDKPPRIIDGVKVKILRDLLFGQEFVAKGERFEKSDEITLPKSNVLQLILEDRTKVSVRPSGTEPKIKFYVSVCESVSPQISSEDLNNVKLKCCERVKSIEKTFIKLSNEF